MGEVGVTQELAEHVANTDYEDLPSEVEDTAKEVVLDGCANMLAGSRQPLSEIVGEYVADLGGPAEASVAGRDSKVHPFNAAYANGIFCHSMDYEIMFYPPTHPTSPSLPALLALAEREGFSGRDVITALAVAFEVQGRLKLAVVEAGIEVGEAFHSPGQVGPLGSAAGCANLLGLTVEQTRMALGISGSRVSGLSANTGTMTKSTHCGNAARMGLESALLARQGFTANDSILEAHQGYDHVIFDGALDLRMVVDDFGSPYRMVEPGFSIKKYPSQYTTHWSIDAALKVREEHDPSPDEIKEVVVLVGDDNEAARRERPETGLEGKFSLTYTVAAALLDGTVGIDTFTDERRFAPDMEDMLPRITIETDPDIPAMDFAEAWSRVTVRTSDGEEYSVRVDRPSGRFDNPLSWEELLEKFHECADPVLAREGSEQLASVIEEFESLDDVGTMMDLFREPAADR